MLIILKIVAKVETKSTKGIINMSAFLDDGDKLEITSEFKETEAKVDNEPEFSDAPDLSDYKPRSTGFQFQFGAPTWSMIIGVIAILGIIGVVAFAFFFDSKRISASRAEAYVAPTVATTEPTEPTTATSESATPTPTKKPTSTPTPSPTPVPEDDEPEETQAPVVYNNPAPANNDNDTDEPDDGGDDDNGGGDENGGLE